MARVSQLLGNRELYSVDTNHTVWEVASKMAELRVGAILVLENGQLCGIFSERDLLRRIVVGGRDPRALRVGEVMTPNPTAIDESVTTDEAMEVMHANRCRHLPVLRGGKVVQLVSMRDLMYYDLDKKAEEIRHMREYIQSAAH